MGLNHCSRDWIIIPGVESLLQERKEKQERKAFFYTKKAKVFWETLFTQYFVIYPHLEVWKTVEAPNFESFIGYMYIWLPTLNVYSMGKGHFLWLRLRNRFWKVELCTRNSLDTAFRFNIVWTEWWGKQNWEVFWTVVVIAEIRAYSTFSSGAGMIPLNCPISNGWYFILHINQSLDEDFPQGKLNFGEASLLGWRYHPDRSTAESNQSLTWAEMGN